VDDTRIESARKAWHDLHGAVRSMALYDPSHARIGALIESHVAAIQAALGTDEYLYLDLEAGRVRVDGRVLDPVADVGVDLVTRLHAEGIRELIFDAGYTAAAARRLVDSIHPYVGSGKRPRQALADRLRWEPTPGLGVAAVDEVDRSDVRYDALTHAGDAWRDLLLRDDPARGRPLERTAAKPAWDCRGGAIDWPDPRPAEDYAELNEEIEAADGWGAPMSRVGLILADVAEGWARNTRLEAVLARVPDEVEAMLRAHRVGDAARLLAPLRRWGANLEDRPETLNARFEFERLQGELLDDRMLALLRESIEVRAVEPSRAASYLAGSGAAQHRRILAFAGSLPEGPYREAMLGVVRGELGRDARSLRKSLQEGAPAVAAMALDLLEGIPSDAESMALALGVLDRADPALRRRAVAYLARYDHPAVSDRILRVLRSEPDLRTEALSWLVQHPDPRAYDFLRSLTRDARFDASPLLDRCRVTRTMGFSDPVRAAAHALDMLKSAWALDPELAAPWGVALAAAGAPEGHAVLVGLAQRAKKRQVRALLSHAGALWKSRYVAPPEAEPSEGEPSLGEPTLPPAPPPSTGRLREARFDTSLDEDDLSVATIQRREAFERQFTAAMVEASKHADPLPPGDEDEEAEADKTWGELPLLSPEEEEEFLQLLDKLDPVDFADVLIDQSALEFETSGIPLHGIAAIIAEDSEHGEGDP